MCHLNKHVPWRERSVSQSVRANTFTYKCTEQSP